MNHTISTSTLRSKSPFQDLQQDASQSKQQIAWHKQQENFMELVNNNDLTFDEKVALLFSKTASKNHLDKLKGIIRNMTKEDMYDAYVRHMDYVGDLPGLARVFTYRLNLVLSN